MEIPVSVSMQVHSLVEQSTGSAARERALVEDSHEQFH